MLDHRAAHPRVEPPRARRGARAHAREAARAPRALRGPHRHDQLRLRLAPDVRRATCRRSIYLCAPFLIWAALRFGMRTHDARPRHLRRSSATGRRRTASARSPTTGSPTCRSMLHLQGYLATIVVTTLFSAALAGRARGRGARDRGLAQPPRGGDPRERQPALRAQSRRRQRALGRRHALRAGTHARSHLAPRACGWSACIPTTASG